MYDIPSCICKQGDSLVVKECICVMKQLSGTVVSGMELKSTVIEGRMLPDELHTIGVLINICDGRSRVSVGSTTDPS